jgi:hypothetical protein
VNQKNYFKNKFLLGVSKIIREELILRSGCRIYPSNSRTLVFCILLNYAKSRLHGNGNEATEYKAKEYLIKVLPYRLCECGTGLRKINNYPGSWFDPGLLLNPDQDH